MFKKPKENTEIKANLSPYNIVFLKECGPLWCRVEIQKYKGWVTKENLWGVYADEIIEN